MQQIFPPPPKPIVVEPTDPITPAETSIIVLNKIQEQLQLAGDELQRMENEGGTLQTGVQAAQANDYLKASNRIKIIVPLVEEINHSTEPNQTKIK